MSKKKEKPIFFSNRISVNVTADTYKKIKAYVKSRNRDAIYEDITAAGAVRYWIALGLSKEEKFKK